MLAEAELIAIRRHLHQIPELAMHEFQTQAYLLSVIKQLPQDWLTIRTVQELPTMIMVKVQGKKPQRTIGYRADIDALPVTEATGLAFSSKHPGVMHACGHDVHMTVALGILSYFSEHQPQDNLIFFFQPAEEAESGGKKAYELGLFAGDWQVDEFYGLHDNPNLPAGAIGCRQGTLFAGTTEVNIDLWGKSGHAAFPQKAQDTVVASAALIMQVQTIISREINPIEAGVITLGKIRAGSIRNVIAGHARIEGTIRGLTQTMIEELDQKLQAVCDGIALSYGIKVELKLNQGGYWPVENNPLLTQKFIDYMSTNPEVNYVETPPAMTGEDFGYLLAKIPGTMFWLGVADTHQLHSAEFNPKESAIMPGITAIIGFLQARMAQ